MCRSTSCRRSPNCPRRGAARSPSHRSRTAASTRESPTTRPKLRCKPTLLARSSTSTEPASRSVCCRTASISIRPRRNRWRTGRIVRHRGPQPQRSRRRDPGRSERRRPTKAARCWRTSTTSHPGRTCSSPRPHQRTVIPAEHRGPSSRRIADHCRRRRLRRRADVPGRPDRAGR